MDDVPSTMVASAPGDALVGVAIQLEPRRQPRLSIFFRLLIAIPFAVILALFEFVAFIAVVGAWFASLVTGRVPQGIQKFVTTFIQYYLEFLAYVLLLTARLPGLSNRVARGPRPELAIEQTDLNRVAVFFRLLLAIPAAIVGALFGIGTEFYVLAMWFVGIFTGRVPRSLHQSVALFARYQTRFFSYFWLMSPTQPFEGMFGDEIEEDGTSETLAEPTEAAPPPDGSESTVNVLDPSARWKVSRSSSTLAKVSLGLGAVGYAAIIGLMTIALSGNTLNAFSASVNAQGAYHSFYLNYRTYNITLAGCTTTSCATSAAVAADQSVSATIQTFQANVPASQSPQPQYNNYVSAMIVVQEDYAQAAHVASVSDARQGLSTLSQDMVSLRNTGDAFITVVLSL